MILSLLISWLFILVSFPAFQDDGLDLRVTAGFDRLYKEGAAVPIIVNASNNGLPIEGEIRVRVGRENGITYTAPVSLPTQSVKRVPLYVHLPAFAGDLSVELVSNDRVLLSAPVNRLNLVGREDLLYSVVSADPGALAYLETITGGRPDAAVAFLDLADLPDVSSAWNALDVLILDDIDTSRLTTGQQAALQAWVENGGQLVVTGGPGGLQTASGVPDLLPVEVAAIDTIADIPALSDFAGVPFRDPGPYIITGSTLGKGVLVIGEGELPILARRAVGQGRVHFLALDPKLAPFVAWEGAETVWNEILADLPVPPPWGLGIQDNYSATQAVASVPGLRLPSVWQLIFFLVIYIVIIGPVNFLVLKRLNRRELAWITIPALVLLFTLLTLLTSFRTRGNSATLLKMAAAYGSIEADRITTDTLIGLYSPRRGVYDLSMPYDSTAFPLEQGFGVLPGSGNLDAIDRSSEVLLRNIRTDTGEIATYLASTHQPRPLLHAAARIVDDGRTIEVTIRHDGDMVFEDAVLIYGQDQLALGDLQPGEEMTQRLPLSAGVSSVPTPDPLFAAGSFAPNPLVNDPSYILGTTNYFNDPEVFARWQLVQSLYDTSGLSQAVPPDPAEAITLAGWMAESTLPVEINTDNLEQMATTLYLLEVSVR